MSEIKANGITLAYELFGDGPPVIITPGGFGAGRSVSRLLAKKLSEAFTVLIYDRRNSGGSQEAFEGTLSEFELFADDLIALLKKLGMAPAHLIGASGGAIVSLLAAHRHPEQVKSLIINSPPTGNLEFLRGYAYMRYIQTAEAAEAKGMQTVLELPYWNNPPDKIEWSSANKERILAMDVKAFSDTLRRWFEWADSGPINFANLTDAQIDQISTPVLVVPGISPPDGPHPKFVAEKLAEKLPNAELFQHEEQFSANEMARLQELEKQWIDGHYDKGYAVFYAEFINSLEEGNTFVK